MPSWERQVSRRALLARSGSLLAAAALPAAAGAGMPQPGRGGTLRFATRGDASGLDPHRHVFYLVSTPLAALLQGLLDLNLQGEPVPGVAEEWEASADLRTYTFRLRKGVLFHNGREVDAAAVKWNLDRLRDPRVAHPFMRAALGDLGGVEVVDRYTLRCHLHQASAAFPANVVYYPCSLIAPDSAEQAHLHPVSCGPFRFVRWRRNEVSELVRFEHYFETDAAGRPLPYLAELVGKPKKEDRVRLTALRAGEVELIDTVAYADAAAFPRRYAGRFQTWEVPTLGTAFLLFNLDRGPFADKRLRRAAAHAIDREAIKQAVFYGQGEIARGFYAPASPWHSPDVRPWPAYDPEQARALLRQAGAVGTTVLLQSPLAYPYLRQIGDLVQAMWSEVGFRVQHVVDEAPVLAQRRRQRAFHAEASSASYRFDPDGWFARSLLSTSPSNQERANFRDERVDRLILEARRTANRRRRLALYAEIDSLVNEELPLLYLHHLTLLQAGTVRLQGYQPGISGAFSTQGAGVRTAWLA
ncbi:MAG: ABC transporter substrate-binding protein [Candidatus Tectimicrobiota bacterium]|nr:MAG: ABC transporter substrate-binding protein [Candidatus Tectomicrobia bacterium]